MEKVFILSAVRTPIGSFQGAFSNTPAPRLGAAAIKKALANSQLTSDKVNECIMGNVLSAGIGQAPARQAALKAGIPASVAALTINKVCGSGLKSVMLANQAIRCGDATVIVAGGMESMSRAPWLIERQLNGLGDRSLIDSMMEDGLRCAFTRSSMGETADRLANRLGISREDQDAYACESHHRASAAQRDNSFKDEIVPITVALKAGPSSVSLDEGPRAECSMAQLAKLRPAFSPVGTVTAGNAAMISDGAAAVVVASDEFTRSRGLKPMAQIVASATSGVEPEDVLLAPIEAVRKLLAKTKHQIKDIDLWEINEAFAVQMLACQRSLGIPLESLNRSGGAIALGHPVGASGARVLTTLLHSLRRHNRELGIATLCLGGGNAVAMLVRRMQ